MLQAQGQQYEKKKLNLVQREGCNIETNDNRFLADSNIESNEFDELKNYTFLLRFRTE